MSHSGNQMILQSIISGFHQCYGEIRAAGRRRHSAAPRVLPQRVLTKSAVFQVQVCKTYGVKGGLCLWRVSTYSFNVQHNYTRCYENSVSNNTTKQFSTSPFLFTVISQVHQIEEPIIAVMKANISSDAFGCITVDIVLHSGVTSLLIQTRTRASPLQFLALIEA